VNTLTTDEAASLLAVTVSQVRRLCIRGQLTAEKRGRDWMIERDDKFTAYADKPTRLQGRGRPRKTKESEG
jgi:excisionase family DNA binding protein